MSIYARTICDHVRAWLIECLKAEVDTGVQEWLPRVWFSILDIITVSRLSSFGRDIAEDVISKWLRDLLERFMDRKDVDVLLDTLNMVNGGIVGSIVWRLFAMNEGCFDNEPGSNTSRDVNFIVPTIEGIPALKECIERVMGIKNWVARAPHSCYQRSVAVFIVGTTRVGRMRRSKKPERRVTISVGHGNILDIVLSSPFSAQQNLFTSSRAYCFWPPMATKFVSYMSDQPSVHIPPSIPWSFVDDYDDMDWTSGCGRCCPADQRKTIDDKGICSIRHTKRYEQTIPSSRYRDTDYLLAHSCIAFRLKIRCANENCHNYMPEFAAQQALFVAGAFKKENEADQALFDLHSLKQGTDESAETTITKFRNLASLAGLSLTENHRVAIDYLKNVLKPALVNKVEDRIDEPETFEEWVKTVIKHDNVWRRNQAMKRGLGRQTNGRFLHMVPTKKPARDPNAMDVDALTTEERKELLQKRACFYCKKPGHFARECRSRQRDGNAAPIANFNTSQSSKLSVKEAARSIRSLLAQYTGQEEDEIFKTCAKLSEEQDFQSMKVPMTLTDSFRNIETRGLVDCAAGGRFIDQDFARKHRLPVKTLTRVLTANNVDGTPNKNGVIREYVQLPITVHGRTSNQKFFITGLGKQNVILGMPWIRQMNPLIDWKLGTLEWRKRDFNSLRTGRPIKPPDPTDISQLLVSISQLDTDDCPEPLWIRLKTTASQTLAIANNVKKVEKPIEELVPEPYHKYLHIFTKEFGEHFPPERPDDMPINLKEKLRTKSLQGIHQNRT
ncbi:hypothetical protein NMY22_g16489 [Coprinellus aureogranulatus]|nr:hypothetical protein NMY22_g16489 [Coprinellus aureogranulatus]